MLLIITYTRAARNSLRNVRRTNEDVVVRWFGRSALFAATELGAFHALRLQEKHPEAVQIERTQPFNQFREVPERVRDAVAAYSAREHASTPYSAFAVGRDLPEIDSMAHREL